MDELDNISASIGFLDSGVGGLTILNAVHDRIPEYDTVYLGDSLHSPYGEKSPGELYELVRARTKDLFDLGCPLVIYACNTASAAVLPRIQRDLLCDYPDHRVLGIIRPTIEEIVATGHKRILIFSTPGTTKSDAYAKELRKINPSVEVYTHSCPSWAPLVEQGLADSEGARAEVEREVIAAHQTMPLYDSVLLGCTHYPYLSSHVEEFINPSADLYHQGSFIAASLENYLLRHPEMALRLEKEGRRSYYVTGDPRSSSDVAQSIFEYPITFLPLPNY